MKFISSIFGLMAVLCLFGDANAALATYAKTNNTGRVSLAVNPATTAAARRLPTLKASTTTATTTSSTTSSLMDVTECVDAYTECIKDVDVCGSDFEECTTNELFYAKKPQCNSVLLQCSSAGINALFGTTSTTNLATKNSNDEYVYPTAGSILGQFIEAGAINNRLDTSACVKRYTSCLKKENVCGEDFELCTSNSEFKKQKIFCESTLARCTDEGKTELFGSTKTDSNPTSASRLGIAIKEGADLAAVNAVSTCYKVVDQCFLSACSANPYKCITDSSLTIADIVDALNEDRQLTNEEVAAMTEARTSAMVSGYIKNSCAETIGGNKYCYATFLGEGQMPTASQLRDENNRDEVYAEAYSARMNSALRAKIQEMADKFDKKTKDKCSETIMACAMRSCGGGLGSVCYQQVFGAGNYGANSNLWEGDFSRITMTPTYDEIMRGCASIVNTDANCQYAAASAGASTYNYNYNETGTFGILFPQNADISDDPIGVIARLNASLAENYNAAAIERMAKQCKNTAVSCIRSLCGADFKNCYRNRTDVMTDTYATEEDKFNQSMNKVGGVLDFTIVRGLCLETVKNADVCDEHLKIQVVRNYTDGNGNTGWGENKTVRDAWVGAVSSGYSAKLVDIEGEFVETGLCTIDQTKAQSDKCKSKIATAQECDTVDEDGCLYDVEQVVARKDYQVSMAADTLFQEVMGDLEKEAQAKYNAKLTAEQHMCVDANNGGIMGRNDHTGTYMWVKLRGRKVPKDYSTNGLKANDFVASNDLYGSFCRARVSVQSDDPDIQRYLQEGSNSKNWTSAYFAVGDVFTCGSWIPQSDLEKIAATVATKKVKGATAEQQAAFESKQNMNRWLLAVGSAGVGGVATDLLQTQTGLGGLLGTRKNTNSDTRKLQASLRAAEDVRDTACGRAPASTDMNKACFKIEQNGYVGGVNLKTYIPTYKNNGTECDGDRATQSCQDISNYITKVEHAIEYGSDDETWWNRKNNGRLVTDAVGALTSGIGVYQLAKSVQKNNLSDAERAAYEEFMNNVGNHIYCFIGADEAGTYGDLIEISVD